MSQNSERSLNRMEQKEQEQQQEYKHNRRRRRTFAHSFAEAIVPQALTSNMIIFLLGVLLSFDANRPELVDAQHHGAIQSSASGGGYLSPGNNMENLRIPEIQPVGSVVYQLKVNMDKAPPGKITYALTGDTFSVDEDTGEVRLIKQLDRERQAQISTVVNVLGSNSDQPLESRRRVITVEDVDDSWPIFSTHKYSVVHNPAMGQYVYQVEVSEQAPVGTIVIGEIMVTDADEGSNADVVFECRARQSSPGACNSFTFDSRRLHSGKYSISVRSRVPLDFERNQSYKLCLVARGRRPSPLKGVPLESEAIINVQVQNIQDEPPVFVNAPYALSVPEGLRSGTRLLTLLVQDGDSAPQRELSMIVVDGPFKEHFQVTKDPEAPRVWYLESNKTIDRESALFNQLAGGVFTIGLLAAELDESGSPVASEQELIAVASAPRGSTSDSRSLKRESVSVLVLDLADSRPVFVRASTGAPLESGAPLVVNVSESLPVGAPLDSLDLAVQDLDQGTNARFRLALVDADLGPQASQALSLDTELVHGRTEVLLSVRNASLLDFEEPSLRTYRFSLVASKKTSELSSEETLPANQQLVQVLDVQLNVLDSNDNWPEFERDQYVVSVPEGAQPGYVVASIRARDRDSGLNGRVDYMLRGPGASKFKLISSEAKIVVNDCGLVQCLDYEIQPSFALTYEARDAGGLTCNVSLIIQIIDANDHAPKFTESVYKRELISDNLNSKQNYIAPQLIVRARDADGPTQGRNNITYRIGRTNLTGLEVDTTSGLVYLSQPLELDSVLAAAAASDQAHERRLVFEAQVVADDNGSPVSLNSSATILLSVKGNRDGAPQFKQHAYFAYVRENQPLGKPFFQVQAIDPDDKDSQLRYSLGLDLNDLLQIDSQTGEISFKNQVDYDDFRGSPYNVSVHATDNSRPYPLRDTALVSVLVQDVNNKEPHFEMAEYKGQLVQGKSKPGDLVLQVKAIDLDLNNQLTYSLLAETFLFTDRNGQQFSLDDLANATQGYLAQSMSRQERQSLVDSLRKLLRIDARTGTIELAAEPDYSLVASLSVYARVQDMQQEVFGPTLELQQDVARVNVFLQTHNDNRPVFAPPWSLARPSYNVTMLEELPVGTQIFSLLAHDPHTNKRVSSFEKLPESDTRELFRVESSGAVLVNKRIDYDDPATSIAGSKSKWLTLSVRALSDDQTAEPAQAQQTVAHLNIQLVDINDNAPQFKNGTSGYKVTVSEAIPGGYEIVTVSAEDRDSDNYNLVHYSLSGFRSELFHIDQFRGVVSVRKGARLDRDIEPNYYLLVTASDCSNSDNSMRSSGELSHSTSQASTLTDQHHSSGCKRSSVPLEITLSDENDNGPVFVNVNKRAELEATCAETSAPGSVIAQFQARDIDEGLNGQIDYELVRSDDQLNQLFKIDHDGFVSVTGSLAGLGRTVPYKIAVRAYDMAPNSSRQTYATLVLTIQDVVANDGVPRFLRPQVGEIITISESAPPNTFVYQVHAVDPDEEVNGKLMYKFAHASDTFDIDPFEGVIKTQNRANFYLDREQIANYTLIIIAQDFGHPPKQAQQVLTIHISDVNDNEPYFERQIDDPPLVMHVVEELPRGSLLGTLHAVDKDEGANALIGYEIIDGNQNNMFRLAGLDESNETNTGSNSPCNIYSNGRLDREVREQYTLTIRANSMSRMRNQLIPAHLRDPLGARNIYQYNASDLTQIRVTIQLIDINDNRPVFLDPNPKSIVDSGAEVYSQLMVIKAHDADSSSTDIQYSILDTLYFSDSKFNNQISNQRSDKHQLREVGGALRHMFDIDPFSGILRNALPLRPYTDGYFEVYIKADSGQNVAQNSVQDRLLDSKVSELSSNESNCSSRDNRTQNLPFSSDIAESCHVAITKAVVFVTHQRETFRFVFNKTKLNDRLDEFKDKIQQALENIMFEPAQAQASYGGQDSVAASDNFNVPRAERVFLNTFQTDFYEREDGSLDFSTITSCSQLVKFDDRNNNGAKTTLSGPDYDPSIVPNQVVEFDEVLSLLKTLNTTQTRQQQQQPQQQQTNIKPSLFSQYGLVKIERCLPDKTMYKMTLSERLALYIATLIALVSILLAFIVSRMRKSYEKNLNLLQRSKYHYGMATAASPFGA